MDVVGSCLGLEYFGVERVFCSPLRAGSGEIRCHHGILPVPAPATVELLKGIPFFAGEYEGEWTTPTGAAILSTFCTAWGKMPLLTMERTGYGAGSADRAFPNLFRLLVGMMEEAHARGSFPGDEVELLETAVDDLNPEIFPYLEERLSTVSVLDYQVTPVVMKKGRVGSNVLVLVEPVLADKAMEVIFKETTTLGVRRSRVKRACLSRKSMEVEVWGETAQVKIGSWKQKRMQIAPEYEDCRRVAKALHRPLKEVYDEVKRQFLDSNKG